MPDPDIEPYLNLEGPVLRDGPQLPPGWLTCLETPRTGVPVGRLTSRQVESLWDTALAFPGYRFVVERFHGRSDSRFLHLHLWRWDDPRGPLGLVARQGCHATDGRRETMLCACFTYRKLFHRRVPELLIDPPLWD
jgi:hypothetical protein